jgi:hypothetical protein
MSRLNFAPLDQAFFLRSDTIKDTRSEIEKLKTAIMDSTVGKKPKQEENLDKKVGKSDKVSATFEKTPSSSSSDMDIFKLIQNPKFDDIVKGYVMIKHPEWINNNLINTTYSPQQNSIPVSDQNTNVKQVEKFTKESFGNNKTTNNLKNYVLFFVFSLLVYNLLEKTMKKR